jgi:D-alanyl-D-alanine carboxypeptidase
LVASATRNGKRLIAVVLGSTSGSARAVRAAQLLERGFGNTGLSWLRPSVGTVESLAPIDATPPNLRDEMCGGKRKRPATDEDADSLSMASNSSGESPAMSFFTAGLQAPMPKASELLLQDVPVGEPMVVYTGPKKTGAALIAAVATDSEKQSTGKRGKRSKVAAKKPDGAAEPKAAESKPAAKPKVQHASAKPEASATAKPAATGAAKPAAAKPAATAKPAASAKPATTAKPKPAS